MPQVPPRSLSASAEPRYVKAGSNGLWIDPGAFAQPTGARFGTCGPNSVRGPGLFNPYMGIFRKFQLNENVTLQFRAEDFNMTNTPHFERPNRRNMNSGTFMTLNRIRNAGRPAHGFGTKRWSSTRSWLDTLGRSPTSSADQDGSASSILAAQRRMAASAPVRL